MDNDLSTPNASESPSRDATMECPVCESVALGERKLKNGLLVDVGPTCRGTWLDGGELLRLTKRQKTTRKGIAVLSSDANESERECPRCQKEMVEGGLLDSDLSVEYCGGCDGLWFDATELKQTILFFESQPGPR